MWGSRRVRLHGALCRRSSALAGKSAGVTGDFGGDSDSGRIGSVILAPSIAVGEGDVVAVRCRAFPETFHESQVPWHG